LSEQQLPQVADVMVSTAASLVNLAGIRLTEKEQRDPAQAKEAIDAARALLPLCPEEAVAPIKDALAQVQMLYVKETDTEARQRAEARSKIWTPPGA
jgi:hypothetical protein